MKKEPNASGSFFSMINVCPYDAACCFRKDVAFETER